MNSRISYEEYDRKLMAVIKGGCDTFDAMCRRLAEDNKAIDPSADSFRITDRRLQALRRKGFVIFENRRWHVQA